MNTNINNRHRLIVPRCRFNTYGSRAFPVAGPTVWNTLPDELRDPACDLAASNSSLKQPRSVFASLTALEVTFKHYVLYKFTFYLLTYLTLLVLLLLYHFLTSLLFVQVTSDYARYPKQNIPATQRIKPLKVDKHS